MAGGFDRKPPQDQAAEQSVLGGMMLSKDAIADVVEVLSPGDFYLPKHQAVYDSILDLYARGEPADPITVSAELERRGELGRVGGAPYLHTLIATVPTAANASYYAEIVAEKAVLRRLVEAGTRIVQMGYNGAEGSEIDEVVDRAQAAVYEVTERRMSEDYVSLDELLQPTMDEIDAIASRGGSSLGVPTGFVDLDEVTNGMHPGQMIIIAARPGVGKALALDTPLPTPTGWTTMGEVSVGDELIDADGRPTRVVAATEVMHDRPCYEVEFSDGTVIIADAQHQWLTGSGADAAVRTTEDLAEELKAGTEDSWSHHLVSTAAALALPDRVLPIAPYALGVWLGAGHPNAAQLRTTDPELRCELNDRALRALGVLGNKHVPADYLRASEQQRRALLAGLVDTSGTVTIDGSVRLMLSDYGPNGRLTADVRELIASLGYRCTTTEALARPVIFVTDDDVFRLERKRAWHQERRMMKGAAPAGPHVVVDIRAVASVPVRCVQVDGADHRYLASPAMIPTHNSTLGLDFARSAAVKHSMTTVIFSLEMSRTEIVMRLLSAEAKIRLQDMRGGRMSDDDWTRLARRMSEISEAPLFIDDSPNMTMMEIRAKARRLKQRNDLKLIVLDYMQLMSSGKRVESRQQEVSEFSRQLKLLAKELEVPVVAISQLNRGPEQRTDKRPMLADLRESGCLTRDTRILRADTGKEVSLSELLASGEQPLVWSVDDELRMVPRPMIKVFSSGVKDVFRMRLASGREVKATANHPFHTPAGWRALGDLATGDRLAVPHVVPAPVGAARVLVGAESLSASAKTAADTSASGPVTGDVRWDQIVEIVGIGRQEVFDATVPGTHNFIANGIVAHNSLEQDAD
ncbi:MAG TPA: replicative DNA helicase, partial [Pseudonocardiaceae bacterium]